MLVVAIDRGQERLSHILPDTVVEPDDRLVVVASGEQMKRLATIT
jgi:Trk K+ transport system NAD-binding subunit